MNAPRKVLLNRRNLAAIFLGGILLILGLRTWWRSGESIIPRDIDQLILFSIDGNDFDFGKEPKTEESFHGFPVLGKTEITDADSKREILEALAEGIAYQGPPAKCFEPRHGLRTMKNGITVDYVICLACSQYRIISEGVYRSGVIGESPRPVFDRYLSAAGIPLARR